MNDLERVISTESALRLLADPKRRQVLRQLADTPDGTTVDVLADELRAGPEEPDGDGSNRPSIVLRHVHLPKLQEADVLEYDADRGTVRPGPQFADVCSLLEVIDDHRAETPTRY